MKQACFLIRFVKESELLASDGLGDELETAEPLHGALSSQCSTRSNHLAFSDGHFREHRPQAQIHRSRFLSTLHLSMFLMSSKKNKLGTVKMILNVSQLFAKNLRRNILPRQDGGLNPSFPKTPRMPERNDGQGWWLSW